MSVAHHMPVRRPILSAENLPETQQEFPMHFF